MTKYRHRHTAESYVAEVFPGYIYYNLHLIHINILVSHQEANIPVHYTVLQNRPSVLE
jgi:hypothetical protein